MALIAAISPAVDVDRTGIQIDRPWAQMLAPGQDTIAVYATVVSARGDTLTRVASPAATGAAIYLTLRKGGRASLYQVKDGVPFASNQPLLMGPAGTQIRLTGLAPGVTVGKTLTLTLSFARAGTLSIDVPIKSSAATGPMP